MAVKLVTDGISSIVAVLILDLLRSITMAKDKPATKKAAAKAQKKAKTAEKTARKEKKKVTKSQQNKDDQDDEDLEDILEKVLSDPYSTLLQPLHRCRLVFLVDKTRMGSCAYSHGRTCGRTSEQTCQCDFDTLSKWKSPLVHRWRVLQRRRKSGAYDVHRLL